MKRPITLVRHIVRRFLRQDRGNIAIIGAVMMIPLTFLLGMGVDYSFAAYRQDQLNGFADSATLAAVTPTMMAQSATASQTAAQSMFLSQLSTVNNIGYSSANVHVVANDTTGSATVTRTVTLSYTANSDNIFSAVLGMPSIPIGGTSQATSSTAPNINFWMLLDDSPSMAIAATTAGINTMVSHTTAQGGCAFACHESDPAADGLGNPGGEDNYALARNLGVSLRIDLVNSATQSLLSNAQTTAAEYNTVYKFALYTMDSSLNAVTFSGTTYSTPQTVTSSQASGLNLVQLEYYKNGWLTNTDYTNDTSSYLDASAVSLNALMPNPGNGTNNQGDTPQEVMFIVTDGVNDFYNSGGSRIMNAIGTNSGWCTTVKNRGIRIAILYLTYNPLPTNSFYVSNIASFQPSISTDAENCASPNLFFEVNTDGDITAAMNTLFQRAVATARLTQ